MPLESCMIIVDNSEFMRNGDYIPTRLEAQQDAANLLVGAKTQSHPESTVGVAAGTELLVSPTEDVGKLLAAVHDLVISRKGQSFGVSPASAAMAAASSKSKKKDSADVTAALQVASLALKHRKNKNGAQRIVLFIGSPLEGIDGRALAKAGRQLKKNNISIDVVAMGELEDNEDKLKELVDAANGRAGGEGEERLCHLVTIPAGVLPSDVLASSPVVHGGSGGSAFAASAAAAAAGAGGSFGSPGAGADNAFADFGGVDPNMDPELAMALRVSMEEERMRQERLAEQARAEAAEDSKDAEMADAGAAGSSSDTAAAAPSAMDLGLSEEEALLQQALAMSMNENEPPAASASAEDDSKPAASASMETEEDDEAAAMQLALQMSLAQAEEEQEKPKGEQIQELLGSLPGVNPNDPAIQSALSNLKKDDDDNDDTKKEGSDDKKE